MILELADIRIHPGQQAAFDEAIQRGVREVISKAKGFQGYKVNKGIESLSVTFCKSSGRHWKTTPSIFASRRRLPTGAPSLGRFLRVRPPWNISACWPNQPEQAGAADQASGSAFSSH